MDDRTGIFAGEDPFGIVDAWMADAAEAEINDPNAAAVATVDEGGLPDVRVVLIKEVGQDGFTFYTNYDSAKGLQIAATGKGALVLHWKSLRRQIRARGPILRDDGPRADAYFASRAPQSRIGAWASRQSRPLDSRQELEDRAAAERARLGDDPQRPPFWGGFRLVPQEIEFWADGAHRLHDRFRWYRDQDRWLVRRLSP